MTMSLDGFVAGPDDGKAYPLGRHGGMNIFDWYTSGPRRPGDSDLFHVEPGVNQEIIDEMFAESGAFIFGRSNVIQLDRIERLPEKLPLLYFRLAG